PNNQIFIAQLSVWDSENDAHEFFDAYVKRTKLRYPEANQLDTPNPESVSSNSKIERRDSYSWKTNEGGVTIELCGSRVIVFEGVPNGVDPKNLVLTSVTFSGSSYYDDVCFYLKVLASRAFSSIR